MSDGHNAFPGLDFALQRLHRSRGPWAALAIGERIELLQQVRERIAPVAPQWIKLSSAAKGIEPGSPLEGEEWTSGPWALLAACDGLLESLRAIMRNGQPALDQLPKRELPGGQLAVRVFPHSIFDRLLLSGVTSEVWMQPGVSAANLAQNTGAAYREPERAQGELGLVLGAGNIASIAPLDALHKLYAEKAVCLVKLNPVNDYLLPVLEHIFAPLEERAFVAFVRGDGAAGAYLCQHKLVDTIHITGSQETHDAIVFGPGLQGQARRSINQPLNTRPISSELGAVSPTIVVPGPWSRADIEFQAAHIATQKLHNSGFNCVACQVLVLPQDWEHTSSLRMDVRRQLAAAPDRKPYYPGAAARQATLAAGTARGPGESVNASDALAERQVLPLPPAGQQDPAKLQEVFAPTLCEQLLDGGADAEAFLRRAIDYANRELRGTLGANIIIHPATRRALGERWDALLQELRYGTIAVNAWTGLGYLLPSNPWGAFPGHTLDDVQSGIGSVHNTWLFDRPQRTVVEAPFRPFPRNLLGGSMTLLPKPPWFVNNRRAQHIGRRLLDFQHRPSWFKLPGIFLDALRG
ncbi:aldehyde dehydrogenase family protein [Pseudoduganella sp. OTU4001]|uniref:aldehyde dehydrogenase family protein n=1 Tax=Pseudoduganella sp. OTU4001 TaxID=3043854 RepID=UPI00313F22F7